jgi:hypothetical protein
MDNTTHDMNERIFGDIFTKYASFAKSDRSGDAAEIVDSIIGTTMFVSIWKNSDETSMFYTVETNSLNDFCWTGENVKDQFSKLSEHRCMFTFDTRAEAIAMLLEMIAMVDDII